MSCPVRHLFSSAICGTPALADLRALLTWPVLRSLRERNTISYGPSGGSRCTDVNVT